jgi:5-methylcytosine-specific restriction endonuclease McrA
MLRKEQYVFRPKSTFFGGFQGICFIILGKNGKERLTWAAQPEAYWRQIITASHSYAVDMGPETGTNRRFWMVCEEVFSETENLKGKEVWAMVMQKKAAKERKIKNALSMIQIGLNTPRSREPIPDEVKMYVWRRDSGQCSRCHGKVNLEFDHIIPLSMGGSNTARNIQLLCAACNKSKGANLI